MAMVNQQKQLKDVDQQLFDKVMRLLEQINHQEEHFNTLETGYRKLASTWLLASLGACGYILNTSSQLLIDRWVILLGIGASASVGIGILWALDQKVYHKLLNSYFTQGLWLEIQYREWLYPVRIEMLHSQGTRDVSLKVQYYYIVSVCLPLVIAAFALWNIQALASEGWIKTGVTLFILVFMVVILAGLKAGNTKQKREFEESELGRQVKDYINSRHASVIDLPA